MPGTDPSTEAGAPPVLPAKAYAPADLSSPQPPAEEGPSTPSHAFVAGAVPSSPPAGCPGTPPPEAGSTSPELWAPAILAQAQHPESAPQGQQPPSTGQEIQGQYPEQYLPLPGPEASYPVPDYTGAPQAGDLEAGGIAAAPAALPLDATPALLTTVSSGSASFYGEQPPQYMAYQSGYLQHMPSSFKVT